MTRIAFVFPGQGAEHPEMGAAFSASSESARRLLDVASTAAGTDLVRAIRRGTVSARTDWLQPALTAVCLSAAHALEARGVIPSWVAGHSLGELAAWGASGMVEPRDVVTLAALRGRLMAREAARVPGGMRVLRLTEGETHALLSRLGGDELTIAAVNADDEVVVSGPLSRLSLLQQATPLATSGAWHSRAMVGADEEWRAAANAMPVREGQAVFISGVRGEPVPNAREVPGLLAEQLLAPVQFARTLRTLRSLGATHIAVPGPARVLRALCRKVVPDVTVCPVETPADADAVAQQVLS